MTYVIPCEKEEFSTVFFVVVFVVKFQERGVADTQLHLTTLEVLLNIAKQKRPESALTEVDLETLNWHLKLQFRLKSFNNFCSYNNNCAEWQLKFDVVSCVSRFEFDHLDVSLFAMKFQF